MCCLSQATWLSRYIKNIIDNFIFLHCRWKASNQTHVYINTDSYLWYITYHPQKLNIHEQKLLIITLDNLRGYHFYHWRLKIRLFVHFSLLVILKYWLENIKPIYMQNDFWMVLGTLNNEKIEIKMNIRESHNDGSTQKQINSLP